MALLVAHWHRRAVLVAAVPQLQARGSSRLGASVGRVVVLHSLSYGARNEDVCLNLFPSAPFLIYFPCPFIHRAWFCRAQRACVALFVLDLRIFRVLRCPSMLGCADG
jgi:hypothetical protein